MVRDISSGRSVIFRGCNSAEVWIVAYEHPWMTDIDIYSELHPRKFQGTKVVVCSLDTRDLTLRKIVEFDDAKLNYWDDMMLQCQGGKNVYCFCVQQWEERNATVYVYTHYGQLNFTDPPPLKTMCENMIWRSIIAQMKSLNATDYIFDCLPVYMREKFRRIKTMLGLI